MREPPLPSAPLLSDVMPDGSRLATGLVILALSLIFGLRGALHQPAAEPAIEAIPQPVLQRFVFGTPLPAMEPLARPRPSIAMAMASDAVTAPPASRPGAPRFASRHRVRHVAGSVNTRRSVLARSGRQAGRGNAPAVVARTGSARTRAQVQREYLRARDVVAALTGEDSGSFYLMRTAAGQRTARLSASHGAEQRHTIHAGRYNKSRLKT